MTIKEAIAKILKVDVSVFKARVIAPSKPIGNWYELTKVKKPFTKPSKEKILEVLNGNDFNS